MEQLEGGDISIEHFLQDQQDFSSTSLQHMFQGSCVLLTGVTGVVGSLVLEKLLRSCPGVSKVYVSVPHKNRSSPNQRLKELFSTKMFDRVRLEQRESLNKVELLDLHTSGSTVTSSVNMIIHCALLIDPQHSLRDAVHVNIKDTMVLMQLAYSCRALEAFVVVTSTASHHRERILEERFYLPPVSAKAMCVACDVMSEDTLNSNTSGVYSQLFNRLVVKDSAASYVTLAIAEHLLRTCRRSLPVAIVRPSMLVASYQEPLAGWLPRAPRGLMKALTLSMRGRLCTIPSIASLSAELMPADLAASLVLAVAAHTASDRRNWQNKEVDDMESHGLLMTDSDVPIFNLVSSNHSPISWKEFFICSIRHARSVPFLDTVWYPHLVLTDSKFWFSVWFNLFHLLPAWCIDSWHTFTENPNILNAKRSRVYQKYQSVLECCEALRLHTSSSQKYSDKNTMALWRALGPSDRANFNFHPGQIDWDEYLYTLARGARLYCQGDPLDTVPRAVAGIKR